MFTEKDYSKPLTEQLSVVIRRYTTREDIANAAAKSKVSISLVNRVVYRTASLTENSTEAIELLITEAIENCADRMEQAKEDLKYLETLKIEQENG